MTLEAADREMRAARARWFDRGEGTLAEFGAAMDAYARAVAEARWPGVFGDVEEYHPVEARRAREELPERSVEAEGDAPTLPVEAGRAPSTMIRDPLAGTGESTARLRDPVGWGACHGLPTVP